MTSTSIWMDVDVMPTAESLVEETECDVAVIGSGIAGISTAYELCRRGKSVIVIDRGRIAGGMTSRTSFSLKNGVRYRFYVSTALRGRKHLAGSVKRVPATEIEQLIEQAIREQLKLAHATSSEIFDGIDRAVINAKHLQIVVKPAYAGRPIEIPWKVAKANAATVIESTEQSKSDPKLVRAIVCQSALNWDPLSASKRDPFERRVRPVALAPSELAGVAETVRARVV